MLVNGSPAKEFHAQKGLRQGDPIVPFLFLIVVEGLAGISRKAIELNLVESLEIEVKKVKVNMLQFANNILFFCETNIKSVFTIKVMLNCFDLASDLKVNFLKSRIGGLGVDKFEIQHFVALLNCDMMNTPFKYLGLLMVGCHKRSCFWVGVIERMKSRLGRWKGRFLSLVEGVYLIKPVHSSIPLFYVSLFKLPSSVLKEIVKLQRNFMWGWESGEKKIAWISWKKVCESREAGGLGILDMGYSMWLCWKNGFGVWVQTREGFGKRLLNQNTTVGEV